MITMRHSRKFLIALPLFLFSSFCFSQVTEAWVKRYSGPEYGGSARDVAVDASGNVYVTGLSTGSGTGYDYATIKYNADGNELWAKRYTSSGNKRDESSSLAVDAFGNVYVTGYSYGSGTNPDITTIKYNAAGTQLWVRRYQGPESGYRKTPSLAVDASGNVYVTGTSQGSESGNDYATIKYNAAGAELWVKRFTGSGNWHDEPSSLAVDGSGNVYVTGYSQISSIDADYATLKYDTGGNEVWVKRYDLFNGPGYDVATALAVDASGNIYVTGSSGGDYTTIKYDAAGNRLWVAWYANSSPVALAVDGLGNVYVTGSGSGSGTGSDYAIVKYNAAGNQIWARQYDVAGYNDFATSLAVDASGNVYVTGGSVIKRTDDIDEDIDYATIKYDAAGNHIWVKRYGQTNGAGHGVANSVATDAFGNVYVTGGDEGDYATIKYSQNQTQTVSSFSLINADNEEAIRELKDGDTLNLATLPTLHLNIRANTNPNTVGSVVFDLTGQQMRQHTENIVPYALFADNTKGDYYAWTPVNGNYTLTATPYSASKGSGEKGTALTIKFYVIYQEVSSFTLVNADTDKDIKILRSGDVIDLSTLSTKHLNVRANTNPTKVGSVVFQLSGQQSRKHTENIVPYALFADNNKGGYYGWTPQVGSYLLTATPYERTKGNGKKGAAYTIAFSVVDGSFNTVTSASAVNSMSKLITDTPQALKESLRATPNPFTGHTTISFSVPKSGYTTLALYNMKGIALKRLYEARAEKGNVYTVRLESGQLPGGMYMLRMVTDKHIQSCKLVLIR